jgi:hypothetical protein
MALATVTGRQRNNVAGHQRVVTYTSIVFAGVGDTWKVSGLKTIMEVSLTPTTAIAAGFTVGTGANSNVLTCTAAGTYRGSVYGL